MCLSKCIIINLTKMKCVFLSMAVQHFVSNCTYDIIQLPLLWLALMIFMVLLSYPHTLHQHGPPCASWLCFR